MFMTMWIVSSRQLSERVNLGWASGGYGLGVPLFTTLNLLLLVGEYRSRCGPAQPDVIMTFRML